MAIKRHPQPRRSRTSKLLLAGLAFSALALPGGLMAQSPADYTIDGTVGGAVYNQTNADRITSIFNTPTIAAGPRALADALADSLVSFPLPETVWLHLQMNPWAYDSTNPLRQEGFVGYGSGTGDVEIGNAVIQNIAYTAGDPASTADAAAVAASIIMGAYSGDGVASASSVTIDNISFSAATASANPALAYSCIAGLSGGDVASSGPVTISNVSHTAVNNSETGGASYALGQIDGISSGGWTGAHGPVSITGVNFTAATNAATGDQKTRAFSGGLVSGVTSLDRAWAADKVTVEATAVSTVAAESGVSAAMVSAYGMRSGNTAEADGDIFVKALAEATGGDKQVSFGQAIGIMARNEITLRGNSALPKGALQISPGPSGPAAEQRIEVEGSTYAFAIASTPGWNDGGLATFINNPMILKAKAGSLDNDYDPYQNSQRWDDTVENLFGGNEPFLPMPVAEAEYIGLNTNLESPDVLNFHFDGLMDNDEQALRIFGAEVVNIGGIEGPYYRESEEDAEYDPIPPYQAELKLFGGSYFINQKAFNHDTDNPEDYGRVSSYDQMMRTDVNVFDDSTLHIAGMIKKDLTEDEGAHSSRFTSYDEELDKHGFWLDNDYTLALNTEAGSTLKFSQLKETDGRDQAWDASNPTANDLEAVADSEAMFNVSELNGLSDEPIKAPERMYDQDSGRILADLAVGEIINVQNLAASLDDTADKTIKVLHTSGADIDLSDAGGTSGRKLFYDYEFYVGPGGQNLYLDIDRNGTALSSVTRHFGASPNADNLADAMAGYRIPTLEGDGPDAYATDFDRWVTYLANLEEGEGALFADQLNRAHGEMHATTVLSLRQYYKSLFGQFKVQSPDGPASLTMYPAYGDESAPSAGGGHNTWTARASVFGNWGRLDQDGRYFGADTDSVAGLLSLENAINEEVTLGLGVGAGTSEVKFDKYGAKSESDDLALAVYGLYRPAAASDFFLLGRLGYGQSSVDTRRETPLGPRAKASYDVDYFNAALTGGYDFRFDNGLILTPSLTLSYLSADADDATEKGGGIHNLHLNNGGTDSFEAIADLELKKIIPTQAGHVKLHANVGLAQEFMDDHTELTTTFVSAPTFPRWRNDSPDVGDTRFLAGAGVEAKVSESAAFALDYQGSFQSNYDNHAAQATFKYSW